MKFEFLELYCTFVELVFLGSDYNPQGHDALHGLHLGDAII